MKRTTKWIFDFIGGILLLAILITAALPSLFSTDWGQRKLLEYINESIPGKIEASQLSFSWMGPQQAQQLQLIDPEGKSILQLDSLELQSSPIYLFQKKDIIVKNLSTTLDIQALERTLGEKWVPNELKELPVNVLPASVSNVDASFITNKAGVEWKASGRTLYEGIVGDFTTQGLFSSVSHTPINVEADAAHLPIAVLDHVLALSYPEYAGLLQPALGDTLNLKIKQASTAEGNLFQINIQTPLLNADLTGHLDQSTITLNQPGQIDFQLTPQLVEALGKKIPWMRGILLSQPTQAQLTVHQFNVPFFPNTKQLDVSALSLSALFSLKQAEIRGNSLLGHVSLQGIQASIEAPASSQTANVHFEGSAKQNGEPIEIKFNTTVQKPKSMDTPLADLFLKSSSIDLATTLPILKLQLNGHVHDDTAEATFTLESDPIVTAPYTLSLLTPLSQLRWDNPNGTELKVGWAGGGQKGYFSIVFDQKGESFLTSDEGIHFHFALNQHAYATLHKLIYQEIQEVNTPKLMSTVDVEINIKSFTVASPLSQSSLVGDIVTGPISLQFPDTGRTLALQEVKAHISSPSLEKEISFQSEIISQDHKTASLNGKIDWHAFPLTGLELIVKASQFPIPSFFKAIYPDPKLADQITALLGHHVDVAINMDIARLNGPLKGALKGENGSLTWDGYVKDGILLLNAPLEAKVNVTPLLGSAILDDYIPFMAGLVTSETPLTFRIDSKDVMIPLHPFEIKQVKIPKATLDLGKMSFSHDGEIASILDILKPEKRELIVVWLTPAYFSLQKGVLKLERVDMLTMNQYPFAAWGNVDLVKDKVNIILGISGLALKHAFDLPSLTASYMLQLPYKGRIGKASIDKRKATTRITALVAQNQGGPHGMLIGAALEIAGGKLGEPAVPAPTTQPFPWESEVKQNPGKPEKKETPPSTFPIDPIQKGAESLLKNLFK